jgi:predicted dehydrogenase
MVANEGQRVRWGVIGCGQIAHDKALPALAGAERCELVALADPDAERLARCHGEYPRTRAYRDVGELLADPEVEAVYIATPNFVHADQTVQAARAGKHVLCEKPMALTAAEGRRMVEAAAQAGVQLMIAYMTLFNPAYLAAKRAADAGLLGEIVFARGRHSYAIAPERAARPAQAWRLDPRRGGGPLMDVGVYSAFTLRELTGRRIRWVSALGATRRFHRLTDWDSLVFSFLLDDGTPGVIEASFTYGSSLYELEGTRGRLSLAGHVSQRIVGRLDLALRSATGAVAEQSTHEVVPDSLPHFYNYQREAEHFSRCVLTGQEPVSSGRKALHELLVADAVRESIQTGRRVEVVERARTARAPSGQEPSAAGPGEEE